jgi:hypothetical protein
VGCCLLLPLVFCAAFLLSPLGRGGAVGPLTELLAFSIPRPLLDFVVALWFAPFPAFWDLFLLLALSFAFWFSSWSCLLLVLLLGYSSPFLVFLRWTSFKKLVISGSFL